MLIPREGSLLLAASGSLRIVCEPSAVNLAWNLIFGIHHQTFGQVVPLWTRWTDHALAAPARQSTLGCVKCGTQWLGPSTRRSAPRKARSTRLCWTVRTVRAQAASVREAEGLPRFVE